MIDPKFNEISVEDEDLTEGELEARERERHGHKASHPARGLSINDTIARNANLSVGSTGVDTSGVSSGSGAGAGSTFVTPEASDSPAPELVPPGRGSGTTPLGDAPSGKASTDRTSFDDDK